MKPYHKIQSIFKRDPETNNKTFLMGQYAMPEFEYLADNDWIFTEKVDGTNIRIHWDGSTVTFGGRSDNAQIPATLVARLQELFPAERFRLTQDEGLTFTLYGEGYGAKIQKCGSDYIPDAVDFILFDVRVGDWWLRRPDVEDIAATFGIRAVPIVLTGTLHDAISATQNGLDSHIAKSEIIMEGLVGTPAVPILNRGGERIITKVKHRDFVKP